jgi:NADPH-dependent curcumin reductase CurA
MVLSPFSVSSSALIGSPFLGLGEGERNLNNGQPSTDARSYIPPVPIDGVMRGAVIGKVVATKSSTFSVGEYVNANSGWAEVAIVKEKELQKLEVPANGKVTDGLGVLGMCRWPR